MIWQTVTHQVLGRGLRSAAGAAALPCIRPGLCLLTGAELVFSNGISYAAGTLETQLAEAQFSNAKLKGEVEKLNDTVFSKTFRAPSAWAEREVKYKMEKKAWDTQVCRSSASLFSVCVCACLSAVRLSYCTAGCLHLNTIAFLSCLVFQVEGLQSTISRLQAENVEYRDNSKSEQFEAQILQLQQKLHQTGVLEF